MSLFSREIYQSLNDANLQWRNLVSMGKGCETPVFECHYFDPLRNIEECYEADRLPSRLWPFFHHFVTYMRSGEITIFEKNTGAVLLVADCADKLVTTWDAEGPLETRLGECILCPKEW